MGFRKRDHLGNWIIIIIFFCIIVISFFTMLKNGLTHGCGRLWGFAADHLFRLLAVINSFSHFLLLLRYFGKKCS